MVLAVWGMRTGSEQLLGRATVWKQREPSQNHPHLGENRSQHQPSEDGFCLGRADSADVLNT